jgi:hypothetical protein
MGRLRCRGEGVDLCLPTGEIEAFVGVRHVQFRFRHVSDWLVIIADAVCCAESGVSPTGTSTPLHEYRQRWKKEAESSGRSIWQVAVKSCVNKGSGLLIDATHIFIQQYNFAPSPSHHPLATSVSRSTLSVALAFRIYASQPPSIIFNDESPCDTMQK